MWSDESVRGPRSRIWSSMAGSVVPPAGGAFFRTTRIFSATSSAWRSAMVGKAVAVRDGGDCHGGEVGGGQAWWPPPPYLPRSQAQIDSVAARQQAVQVHQDLRLSVHEPENQRKDMVRAVRSAPVGAPLHPRPLQHHVEASEADGHVPAHRQATNSFKSCELCWKPSNLCCHFGSCKCHAYFVMPVYCQIKCEGAGFGCDADEYMLEAECGAADYSAHAGGGSAPIPIFSAQLDALRGVHRCDTHMLAVLENFVKGFFATILTPKLLPYFQRRPHTLCLISYSGFSALQICLSGCYTSGHLQAAVHDVFVIFAPLGLIRRRRSFLRFSGEDFSDLSSVVHPLDLQLNHSPQMRLPTQLLVERLALRLA